MEKPLENNSAYTKDQLELYLNYIGLAPSNTPPNLSVTYLTKLIQHHVSTIPFDNLYLHYSKEKYPSLNPDAVFTKCVGTRKGGFCVEQNRLFGQVLNGMGFTVTMHGARVHSIAGNGTNAGDWYFGWTHMVNLVEIDGITYLVDVGFGGAAPTKPLPLHEHNLVKGWGNQELRLTREVIRTEGQMERLWVYEQRPSMDDSFAPVYAFTTMQFLPQDYAIINHYVTTHPVSWFTFHIVCMKFTMEKEELVGMMIMDGDEFYRKTSDGKETLKKCVSEKERVDCLKKYFGIVLSQEEQDGILMKESRLRG